MTIGNHGSSQASTKKRIINSARELFAEQGYQKTTVVDISRHAGLSETALYEHFKGKEDLLLRFIAEGRPDEALAVILEKVPFPGILGRVCMHPREQQCKRREVNQPISICSLKLCPGKGGCGFRTKQEDIRRGRSQGGGDRIGSRGAHCRLLPAEEGAPNDPVGIV